MNAASPATDLNVNAGAFDTGGARRGDGAFADSVATSHLTSSTSSVDLPARICGEHPGHARVIDASICRLRGDAKSLKPDSPETHETGTRHALRRTLLFGVVGVGKSARESRAHPSAHSPAVAAGFGGGRPESLTVENFGANDGGRTRDIQDHNLALCQLSYVRRDEPCVYTRRPGVARARCSGLQVAAITPWRDARP